MFFVILPQTRLIFLNKIGRIFILNYFSIDWDVALKLDEQNVNYSTESFLNKINSLLSNYAPLKKINKYKLKFRSKPWITTGLQKSISVKNKFLTNFIKKKDPAKKQNFTETYYQPTMNLKKIITRNTLSQIGIMPNYGKVLNLCLEQFLEEKT